jgi:hypothetical protein
MFPQIALVAVAAFGIDVGWKPLDGGGVVYIIQIAPDQIDRLKNYDDLLSDMPKDLDVRQIKITIGKEKLPRSPDRQAMAKPAIKERELVAEGSIPALKQKQEKASAADAPSGPQLIAPTDSVPENHVAKSEGIEQAASTPEKTTTLRPVDRDFSSRDPKPRDEEESDIAPTRTVPEERPVRDELFATPPSRPLTSRPLADPREAPQPQAPRLRPPVTSVPADRYVSEPEEDYEAAKPALPSSFRTADSSTRLGAASDERGSGSNDAPWGPVVAIFFFLLLSMGANMWLAWIAWEARQRYQVLLDKYRAVGGKPAMELV